MKVKQVESLLRENPETKWSKKMSKICSSSQFGVIRKCFGDSQYNTIANAMIKDKIDSEAVQKKFGVNGYVAGRIASVVAQLKACELINNLPVPKTKVQKASRRYVKEKFKVLQDKKNYFSMGILKGREMQSRAAQALILSAFEVVGLKGMEVVPLANGSLELRKEQ